MLIVCPSCATSYDVEPASLLPEPRPVRCRTVWHAETSCHTRIVSDNTRRNTKPATSGADHNAHVNHAAARERIAGLNAFELIREQAYVALNAIRTGCREDHNRIISRPGVADAILPTLADKLLAAAAALAPRA
jgi:predicted Zn finger-like uncharacterized protein